MTRTLSTAQVAQRLGVQPATIYAYVSRGVLQRTLAEDGTSRFDAAEVERVALRGRPRIGAARRGTVDVSIATSVTRIEADRLSYRGHDATALAAGRVSFERVAELLWTGGLPDAASWPSPDVNVRVVRQALATPLQRFAATAAAIAPRFTLRQDLRVDAVRTHARALVLSFVECLPLLGDEPSPGASLAARLWPRLTELPPSRARVAVLDAALVLLADHELATSTMAVRVAASTRANPFAAVLAGLGALDGPLHGGAANDAYRLLLAAADSSPAEAVARALATGTLRGFGHPVYREADPRAVHLLARIAEIATRREQAQVSAACAAAVPVAGAAPNSDFALGALAQVTKMVVGSAEAIFALARTAGWLAHALEEYGETPLRYRARAIWVGE